MRAAAPVLVLAGLLMSAGCNAFRSPADRLAALDPAAAPVLAAAEKREPAAFEALVRHMGAHGTDAPETARRRLHASLRERVLPVVVSRAGDRAVRDYVAATRDELEALRGRSYYRCHAFLFGDRSDGGARIELESVLPPAVREKSLQAMAALVESAGDRPVPIDETMVNDALDRVVLPLMPARYRERVVRFRASDVRILDTATACDVTIDLYRVVQDLPPPDGALLRRHLLLRLASPGDDPGMTP